MTEILSADNVSRRFSPHITLGDRIAGIFGAKLDRRPVMAVTDVTLSVQRGETLGLVGESGCGKSVTARAIMRLLEQPSGQVLKGEVKLEGRDLLPLPLEAMRKVRGKEIAMIFQEPMTALNPVHRVGKQIVENLLLHEELTPAAALKRALELMEWVGIPAPDQRIHDYPHQLSGGMRQRVMIAMALACQPTLLLADEPTTALDVTIQAQILELLRELQRSRGMGIMLITHNLGVVAENADVVCVMYAGRVVEYARVFELFDNPLHPYTRGLFNSIPLLTARKHRLTTVEEVVKDARQFTLPPSGRLMVYSSDYSDIVRPFDAADHSYVCSVFANSF